MTTKVVFLTTVGSGTYTIPADFGTLVSIEAIGGGSGGGTGGGGSSGGGGAYAKSTSVTGLVAGNTAYYQVGSGSTGPSSSASNSWFNVVSNAQPSTTSQGVLAKGAIDYVGGTTVDSIGDVKYAGGSGETTIGFSGGGGAGGPSGAGANGGVAGGLSGTDKVAGGGGASNGGSVGQSTSGTTTTGGNGGNSILGSGGGAGGTSSVAAQSGTAGTGAGGGGSGTFGGVPGSGATGSIWTQSSNGATAGPGGGGGGATQNTLQPGGAGGLYGGGGGAGTNTGGNSTGAQGIIVFTYTATTPPTPSGPTNNYGVTTGFKVKDQNTGNFQDLGSRYVSKAYLMDVYSSLVPGRYSSGIMVWGTNSTGSLGDGTVISKSSPVQLGTLKTWKQISFGRNSFAIKNDGTLWGWGSGLYGVLGDGTTLPKSSPVQIGALTDWKSVVCGNSSTTAAFAIKTNGTLWAWGENGSGQAVGQLGDGTTISKSSPVQIGGLTNWKHVAFNDHCGAAITIEGKLYTWGDNANGVLGLNIAAGGNSRSSPVQVGALTNWKQISVSDAPHMCAVKTDGTLWSWGVNQFGSLGDGTTTDKSSPVQVGSLTNWKQVTAGGDSGSTKASTMAIKDDGTLWAWGDNSGGQLGLGHTNSISSPVQVGSLTNWKSVALASGGTPYYALAIKTDGTLWAWGDNSSRQLGDGTSISKSSPVQIGTLTNWKQITIGGVNPSSGGILDGQI